MPPNRGFHTAWVDAGILVITNINAHQQTAMRQAGDGRAETDRPTSTGLRTAESGQNRSLVQCTLLYRNHILAL